MNYEPQRRHAREILSGSKCLSPASVFDPLSARVAEAVGYKLGLFSGSVAAATGLAAPDVVLVTLTEFADQIRRIMRASSLSLLVDADHGYGNALNAMRTVEELEHAGVSIIGIEDTAQPMRFGRGAGPAELVSIPEMVGKLRASLAARQDPSLVIAARSAGIRSEGTAATVERVKAYAATGVDALFIVEANALEQIQSVHTASDLPIIVGSGGNLDPKDLERCGGRILLQGHQSVAAVAKALHDTYTHLHGGGKPADLKDKITTPAEMERLVRGEIYKQWQTEYLST